MLDVDARGLSHALELVGSLLRRREHAERQKEVRARELGLARWYSGREAPHDRRGAEDDGFGEGGRGAGNGELGGWDGGHARRGGVG